MDGTNGKVASFIIMKLMGAALSLWGNLYRKGAPRNQMGLKPKHAYIEFDRTAWVAALGQDFK